MKCGHCNSGLVEEVTFIDLQAGQTMDGWHCLCGWVGFVGGVGSAVAVNSVPARRVQPSLVEL